MDRRLLVAVVFCLCFANILSFKCFRGTVENGGCWLISTADGCGEGEICQCAKYGVACAEDDQACEKQEDNMKWLYVTVTKTQCERMKAVPSVFKNLKCCSTNQCNAPRHRACSFSQSRRRRAIYELTDAIKF